MTGNITNYFASGNTARGFVSMYESSLQGLNQLIVVEGGLASEKAELFREIGERMVEEGHDAWFIHCASNNESLDGLVFPGLKVGIVDATAPREVIHGQPEEGLHYFNLSDSLDTAGLILQKSAIDNLTKEIALANERAYAGFAEALRVHDGWEAVYIANMDFEAADRLTQDLISTLFQDRTNERESRVDHRFLGAATPLGAVDFVPNLTDGVKRYFIKGRPGSGKSTMLKKIAAAATERGFNMEIYHCGFDPNSLDMVIVRELGFAIFDSTAPHEYFPEKPTDEIIDMYEHCIKKGTDEEHAETIQVIKEQYSAKMKESIQQLARAKSLQDELEQIYSSCADSNAAQQVKHDIQQLIVRVAAGK
ncbi:PRK06851 family protein [Paenibacillus senegalensis]|uniref:PRK06851 family protein n=1 Tax=Paenibacillus senegalensis TaxID=1465766 RepID=UPI000475395B|nr:PRK06851 family protein [Paenibacillus senegalensis]